jgi:hypothetical protein
MSSRRSNWREIVLGKPRDILSPATYHAISLIALLAWVGLGADPLSSSAYGPDEAFRALGDQAYLATWWPQLTKAMSWLESVRAHQWRERAELAVGVLEAECLSRMVFTDRGTYVQSPSYDPPLREQLIRLYAERNEPEATDKLLDIARAGTDPDMRRYAISALSRKNDPRTKKLLLEIIDK